MADCFNQSGEPPSDEESELDPRVKAELEALNSAAESINKLENELQLAKVKFRQVKTESSHRLSAVSKQIGKKWVIKARPYYDLLRQSKKAQVEAQRSAMKFQQANGIYKAAKETVTLAEERLFAGDDRGKISLDSAWQEMMNHATAKKFDSHSELSKKDLEGLAFMAAEKEKSVYEVEHQTKADEYTAIQQRLAFLLKDIPRTITKAKPFYEMKEKLENRLHAERQNAEDLQLALICSKQKYRMALASLELISDQVHMQRKLRHQGFDLPLRTPGVGAELDSDLGSELSDMPSANLDFMSETASQASWDDFGDSRCTSPALSVTFDDNPWEDDISSPDSRPPTSFASEPPPPPTNPPTFTSSMWTRFGDGLSRLTQDIIKVPAVPAEQLTNQGNSKQILTPRDDVVDGAEGVMKNESIEAIHGVNNNSWNLPESFRAFQPVSASTKQATPGIGHWSSDSTSVERSTKHAASEVKSMKESSATSVKAISAASGGIANITSNISVLGLNSVDCSQLNNSSSTASFSATQKSPPKSSLRRSASETSMHDNVSLVGESVHSDVVASPSSESKVTAKPPIPRHRRTPSATVAMETAAKKLEDAQLCRSIESSAGCNASSVLNFEPETVNHNDADKSATKARKSLKLVSGNDEIFV